MMNKCPKCGSKRFFIDMNPKESYFIEIDFNGERKKKIACWCGAKIFDSLYEVSDCMQKYWLYPDGRITRRNK